MLHWHLKTNHQLNIISFIMSDSGLVSIISPTWNCALFIADTIRSIQAQTYTNWEMLIVDDCSSDNTLEVIMPFMDSDKRIKYFRNEKNAGAAMSRNHAFREAKGRWIAFLDSDDLWTPDKLEKQIEFMVNGGYHFSYTQYKEINEAGAETGVLVSGPKHVTKRGMYNFCWPGCLTVMYDADVVGLVQISDIKKNNDYAMWLKVCHKADCHLLAEPLAFYRRGRAGSISSHGVTTMMRWHFKLFNEADGKGKVASLWLTAWNMFFGFYKKIRYVKKYNV